MSALEIGGIHHPLGCPHSHHTGLQSLCAVGDAATREEGDRGEEGGLRDGTEPSARTDTGVSPRKQDPLSSKSQEGMSAKSGQGVQEGRERVPGKTPWWATRLCVQHSLKEVNDVRARRGGEEGGGWEMPRFPTTRGNAGRPLPLWEAPWQQGSRLGGKGITGRVGDRVRRSVPTSKKNMQQQQQLAEGYTWDSKVQLGALDL